MAEDTWILKILSGSHVGAEVPLSVEEAVLGKDEDCDLVLDDVSLSSRHISLSVAEDKVLLKLLDEDKPVRVDGEQLTGASRLLEPFQVITIGTLLLAAGPANMEWPAIDALLEKKTRHQDDAPDETTPGAADPPAEPAVGEAPATEEADSAQPASTAQPSETKRKKSMRSAGLLVMALVVLACGGILALRLTTGKVGREPQTFEQKADLVKRLVADYNANIKIIEDTGGEVSLSGFIDTERNRRALLQRLTDTDISYASIDIISPEKAVQALSIILDNRINRSEVNSVEVVTRPQSPGDFILQGYVRDAATWEAAKKALRQAVTGYGSLKDAVQTREDRIMVLEDMLLKAGLNDQVDITRTEQGVTLSGKVAVPEKEKLLEIKQAFNTKFASRPALVLNAESHSPGQSSIDLDIRGVSLGSNPTILMTSGQRYGVGARLANGYVIQSITSESIVLKKGDEFAYYYPDAAP